MRDALARRGIMPAGMPLAEAAAYMGLSPNTFLAEVAAGNLPPPLPLKCRRKVWSRAALDAALGAGVTSEPTAEDIDAAIEAYVV